MSVFLGFSIFQSINFPVIVQSPFSLSKLKMVLCCPLLVTPHIVFRRTVCAALLRCAGVPDVSTGPRVPAHHHAGLQHARHYRQQGRAKHSSNSHLLYFLISFCFFCFLNRWLIIMSAGDSGGHQLSQRTHGPIVGSYCHHFVCWLTRTHLHLSAGTRNEKQGSVKPAASTTKPFSSD